MNICIEKLQYVIFFCFYCSDRIHSCVQIKSKTPPSELIWSLISQLDIQKLHIVALIVGV